MQGDSIVHVSLDKPRYDGDEKLTGEAQLTCVKPEEVFSLSIRIEANYHSELACSDIYSRSLPVYTRKKSFDCCFYSKEHNVFQQRLVLDTGTHKWKFGVVLPETSTPSAIDELSKHDFGSVTYNAFAIIGRKKGPFALGDLSSSAPFVYFPQHQVSCFDSRACAELDINFTNLLRSGGVLDKFRSIEPSEGGSDHQNLISTIVTCPRDGLRQDVGNNLNVVIMSPHTHIRVTRVILNLEVAVHVCQDKERSSRGSLGKYTLVDKKLDLKGSVVDLGSHLADVRLPELVPSFEVYGCHRHFHRLHIACSVSRGDSLGSPSIFKNEIVIRVLSPQVGFYDSPQDEDDDEPTANASPPAYTKSDEAAAENVSRSEEVVVAESAELPRYERL